MLYTTGYIHVKDTEKIKTGGVYITKNENGQSNTELLVRRIAKRDKGFGIEVEGEKGTFWINSFDGEVPADLTVGSYAKIPYYEVKKGDRVFYNYGEKRKPQGAVMGEINEKLDRIENLLKQVLGVA